MALDMFLELEGFDPDWKALDQALISVGIDNYENTMMENAANGFLAGFISTERKMSGIFIRSHSKFYLSISKHEHGILAEGDHGCTFKVRYTIIFRINTSFYEEFIDDIHALLKNLAETSSMQFVLSFQYEDVRAIRNKSAFKFLWNSSE